ncbi:unnamed protein product [Diamesa serratosioi]
MNSSASVQERLQLKRVPLDKWSIKEQLCLASAVASSGDQNWMSVSRALKGIVNFDARPADWFTSKSCATQYGKLLDNVETPKRKKRTASERDSNTPVETPVESLVKKLTTERVIEMKKLIQDEQQQYQKMKEELLFLQSSSMDETRIREMWNQIEQEKIQKEREQVRYDQWLKEREEKKLEMERQWRPNYGLNKSQIIKATKTNLEVLDMDIEEPALSSPLKQQNSNLPGTSPSPLLTSLLKSPSQANTQNTVHVSGSTNSARSAPTITNLLTGGSCIISSASNSPNIILQNPLPTQINSSANPHNNIIINASGQLLSSAIDHNNVVQIPPSQSAPTLITLLDKKPAPIATTSINFNVSATGAVPQAQLLQQQSIIELSTASGSNTMDTQPEMNADDSQLYAEFRDMMDPKFEIDEDCLEDINSIISAPEMDKMGSGAPIKMEVNVSQLSNADDYDQLRIKQLVESFDNPVVGQIPGPVAIAPVKNVEVPQETSIFQSTNKPTIFQQFQQQFDAGKIAGDDMDLSLQVTDTPDLPQEFNKDQESSQDGDTSKIEVNAIETIEVTSDENSNTNEMTVQPESIVILKEDEKVSKTKQLEETKVADENITEGQIESGSKDPRIKSEVQIVIQKCDKEEKVEDVKESVDESMPEASGVINVNDSDEDADIFEDAKEQQEHEVKKEAKLAQELLEKSVGGSQTTELGASKATTEEEANSTCISLDSDDDIIEVSRSDKVGRVTRDYSRKKISDTPSKSDKEDHAGKSREVSENSNDDNNSDTPITRTRSRNSSTVPDTTKTSSASTGYTVEQDHTMWKGKFRSAMQQISELKDYEVIIDGKVIPNESQKNVIYHPMNLRQLQRNVENDILTMPSDVKRDFGLMCTNIIMLNKKGSKFNDIVYKFMKDSWDIFEECLEVEDTFKSYPLNIRYTNVHHIKNYQRPTHLNTFNFLPHKSLNEMKLHIKRVLNMHQENTTLDNYISTMFNFKSLNPTYVFRLPDKRNLIFRKSDFSDAVFPNVTNVNKFNNFDNIQASSSSKHLVQIKQDDQEELKFERYFFENNLNSNYDDADYDENMKKVIEENVRSEKGFISQLNELNEELDEEELRSEYKKFNKPKASKSTQKLSYGKKINSYQSKKNPEAESWEELGLFGWEGSMTGTANRFKQPQGYLQPPIKTSHYDPNKNYKQLLELQENISESPDLDMENISEQLTTLLLEDEQTLLNKTGRLPNKQPKWPITTTRDKHGDADVFLARANNPFGHSTKWKYSNSTEMGEQREGRSKRGVFHLYSMIKCATGCDPLIFKGYGCYCGFLGSGRALDGIDRCCKAHDYCYNDAGCPSYLEYFVPYLWKCYKGRPLCAVENGEWGGLGSCASRLCECDKALSKCLRRHYCPKKRTVCTTSPLRLLQNLVMVF